MNLVAKILLKDSAQQYKREIACIYSRRSPLQAAYQTTEESRMFAKLLARYSLAACLAEKALSSYLKLMLPVASFEIA